MTWLEELVGATRRRLEQGYYDRRPTARAPVPPSLRAAIQRAYPAVVAEIKPASPSGEPRPVDVQAQAQAYAAGGACAISVLTDPDHFGGSLDNLALAGKAGLPLLMKDFVLDPRQLEAARAWGASAVLLIARLHTGDHARHTLAKLAARARELELETLIEVVTEDELDLALEAGADVLGINARDLDTLEMDPHRTATLLAGRDLQAPVLHLSGIKTPEDVARALEAGAQGVLVGTSLMKAQDPARAVRSLTEVTR